MTHKVISVYSLFQTKTDNVSEFGLVSFFKHQHYVTCPTASTTLS